MNRILLFTALVASTGCVKPPEIVMVDRGTALEQQAGGSFGDIERKLGRKSIEARPVPLTPRQLDELGIKPLPIVDATEQTEADRVDALLVQHCLGEGRDGRLVDTRASCVGAADHAEAQALMERVNGSRLQLWKWMHEQRPSASLDELRRTWHAAHVKNVVCGAWVEGEPKAWTAKEC